MAVIVDRVNKATEEIQLNHKAIAEMGDGIWKLEYGLMLNAKLAGHLARQVQRSSKLTRRLHELTRDLLWSHHN